MVPWRRWGLGAAGMEAEHDRSAGALSGGVLVRAICGDAGADGLGRDPILRGALHQQCGEYRRYELARALDRRGTRMVAEALKGEPEARRPRRRGIDVL